VNPTRDIFDERGVRNLVFSRAFVPKRASNTKDSIRFSMKKNAVGPWVEFAPATVALIDRVWFAGRGHFDFVAH